MSNYLVTGTNPDDYDDDYVPLTAAQIAARDAAWPEFAELETEGASHTANGHHFEDQGDCLKCGKDWFVALSVKCGDGPELAADQIARADVAAVLTELRDVLAADKMHGAVGRVQAAMHQLGVEY